MPDDLRVALAGFGVGGAVFHAPLIAATPGLRLAAVVTGNPERAQQVEARYAGTRVFASTDALWRAAGDLDLVVVATPNRTHVPVALDALTRGLPVVVDKPVAVTSADAERLRSAAVAAGRSLTVFQNRRWDGDLLTVRRLLADGALGEVHRFESRFERWRPQVRPGSWRETGTAQDAAGVLFDLGSHLVDQALLLFGPVASVYAETRTVRRPPAGASGAAVDDAFVALTHAGGTVSHLWTSLVAADLGPRLRVLGSRAAYVKHGLDGQEAALRAGADPAAPGWGVEPEVTWGRVGTPERSEPLRTEPGAYGRFYAEVERHLRGAGPVPVDPAEAVTALRVLEAAVRSATTGQAVDLAG
jgi:predicted dehydrogenase